MAKVPLKFFCDESSHSTDRFMIIGGIAVRSGRDEDIRREVKKVFLKHNHALEKEIKWSKFRRHQLAMYEELVEVFFSFLYRQLLHYHVLIFDTHKIDRRNYQGASKDGVLNRMYYQIFLHRCLRNYGRKCDIWLFPDQSHSLIELPTFRDTLNSEANRKFSCEDYPVRNVQLVSSDEEQIMQLNDIIVGAIGFIKNQRYARSQVAAHKLKVAEMVRHSFNVDNYDFNTRFGERIFTLWNFQSRDLPKTIPARRRYSGRDQTTERAKEFD